MHIALYRVVSDDVGRSIWCDFNLLYSQYTPTVVGDKRQVSIDSTSPLRTAGTRRLHIVYMGPD